MSLCSPSEFLSVAMLCDTISVDTETNGKDCRDGTGFCVGISAAVKYNSEYYAAYFPVAHHSDNIDDSVKELFFQILESRSRVVMHHAKFDIVSLKTVNKHLKLIRWYCTMMMAHMLNENAPKGLDWLAQNELKEPGKVKKDYKGIWKMGLGHMIPVAEMEEYATEDAILPLKLFERFYPFFVESGFDGPPL